MDITWDGVTQAESLNTAVVVLRQSLADAARDYDWCRVLDIVAKQPELANTARLGGASLYAPMHQVAHGGAPPIVAEKLIELGAWRTLQNAQGERPVDVAVRQGHTGLLSILEPVYRRQVPSGILQKVQSNFHMVIRGRADRLIDEHTLRLPELEPLLELVEPRMWFPVPGMYGGFRYWLESAGVNAKLICESWCRVAEGSGERHEITSARSLLVEEGFV